MPLYNCQRALHPRKLGPVADQWENAFDWRMQPDCSSTTTTEMPCSNEAAHGTPLTVIHSGCDLVAVRDDVSWAFAVWGNLHGLQWMHVMNWSLAGDSKMGWHGHFASIGIVSVIRFMPMVGSSQAKLWFTITIDHDQESMSNKSASLFEATLVQDLPKEPVYDAVWVSTTHEYDDNVQRTTINGT